VCSPVVGGGRCVGVILIGTCVLVGFVGFLVGGGFVVGFGMRSVEGKAVLRKRRNGNKKEPSPSDQ